MAEEEKKKTKNSSRSDCKGSSGQRRWVNLKEKKKSSFLLGPIGDSIMMVIADIAFHPAAVAAPQLCRR